MRSPISTVYPEILRSLWNAVEFIRYPRPGCPDPHPCHREGWPPSMGLGEAGLHV
jgi:hypothetical protein